MAWDVVLNKRVQVWFASLDTVGADRFAAALAELESMGPGLGRPFADRVKGSRHHNMKELRVGSVRALFAFDPHRRAVVLTAGDKAGDWRGWYERNIPIADRSYDAHLRSIGGGEQVWQARGAGVRSAASGR